MVRPRPSQPIQTQQQACQPGPARTAQPLMQPLPALTRLLASHQKAADEGAKLYAKRGSPRRDDANDRDGNAGEGGRGGPAEQKPHS
ncbi:MAG: hypothetical protein OEU26_03465 [Candidatus Tectomicrobia bacterium]|nr:hypothetical protein [Candidatus Tectomicrobia bacterium]